MVPKPTARLETELVDALRTCVGRERYELWFRDNTSISLGPDGLVVEVPNRFYQEWLDGQFHKEIGAACEKVFGKLLPLRFQISAELVEKNYRQPTSEPPSAIDQPAAQEKPARKPKSKAAASPHEGATRRPAKQSRFSLGRFVVGAPNRVAHAAALAIVENPNDGLGPLYLHSAIGLGKSHLLRAIEDGLRHRHPQLKVSCYGCEEFTNEFVESWKGNRLPAFRKKIRSLDVLLVDDVQFLANKKGTQEEFLHALESIQLRGGKIVLAGDVHPRRLGKVPEELKSRFLAGMVAKLDPPNREMRRQILSAKNIERGGMIGEDVIGYLADHLRSNVRELEGAVNYLTHAAETLGGPLDMAASRQALGELLRNTAPAPDAPSIVARACELFQLSRAKLFDRSRVKAAAHARAFVLYLVRKHTGAPYSEIGRLFGGLNHSTVMTAEKKIVERLAKDDFIVLGDRLLKLRDAVETFEREIGPA